MKFFFGLLYVLLIINYFVEASTPQRRLLEKLFRTYNRLERPVANDYDSLNVSLGLTLQQIVNIDEKMQNMVFSGWLDIKWTDYSLDVLLYNSADDSFDSTAKVNAVVEHTGEVNYIPPGMFRSTCNFIIRDFPFDKQICSLKFGSDRGQNGSYIKNAEWILEDIVSFSESISYECCPDKYPFVMFDIHIRRRTLYYEFNLIFPCILISSLTLLGFMLPPDSGEKIGLEVTILLVMITFSQIISNSIPPSSLSVSRIGIYFMSIMCISSMSIMANIFVLIIHYRNVRINDDYMPEWIEVFICEYLAKLLRMKPPMKVKNDLKRKRLYSIFDPNNKRYHTRTRSSSSNADNVLVNAELNKFIQMTNANNINNNVITNRLKNQHHNQNHHGVNAADFSLETTITTTTNNSFYEPASNAHTDPVIQEIFQKIKTDMFNIKQCLNSLLKELSLISNKIRETNEDEDKELKCKFAAVVIDRLCMIIFTFLLLATTSIIFSAENFLKDSDPSSRF